METPSFRTADASDLPSAVSVLREAAEWLIQRSMPLWKPEDFSVAAFAPYVDRGELIVGNAKSEVVVVALRMWEDAQFWPDRTSGEAAYLHKIAIRRSYSGKGLPAALVDWVRAEAARSGRRYLRLDCAPRPALINLYGSLGFQKIDERSVGEHTVVRMELPLNEVFGRDHPRRVGS
jgi:GNAT superfamily N-acetyltransferase